MSISDTELADVDAAWMWFIKASTIVYMKGRLALMARLKEIETTLREEGAHLGEIEAALREQGAQSLTMNEAPRTTSSTPLVEPTA